MSNNYKTAKFVIVILEVFGWLNFTLGFILLAFSTFAVSAIPTNTGIGFSAGSYVGFAIALGSLIAGLFLVAGSQLLRAQVNMATDTAHIRDLLEAERKSMAKKTVSGRQEPRLRA